MSDEFSSYPREGEPPAPDEVSDGTNRHSRAKKNHARLASYWFGNNFHWGAMLLIMLPGDVARIVPDRRAWISALLNALGAAFALAVPLVSGALSDRSRNRIGRRRPFMAWGNAINVIGLMLMAAGAASLNLWLYGGGFMVVQFGNNLALGSYMGIMPDLVVKDERGMASGFMALMSQVGTLAGSVCIGMLLGGQSPWIRYGMLAAVLTASVAIGWNAMDERPLEEKPGRMDWSHWLKSIWISPREHPDFFWVWITRFLVMLGFYAVVPQVKFYLVDVARVPVAEVDSKAPLVLGLILLISSFSGLYGGALSDRIGRKRVVYWANGMIAVVALGFIFARNLETALAVGALFGLGYGAYISVDYALGNEVLPDQSHAGKDMAVWHIAMTLPQIVIEPIAALILESQGKTLSPEKLDGRPFYNYTLNGYTLVFILCSACFALGAVLLKNVRGVR